MWYAKNGIAVFPCRARDKRPATSNGFKDATTDVSIVKEWWGAHPDANIGAPTGLLFDVIDADGPEAVGVLYGIGHVDIPEEFGHSLTARAQGHHIFIKPTGAGNKAGIYPHVDFRSIGGYVILPPSIGANGNRYKWTRPSISTH